MADQEVDTEHVTQFDFHAKYVFLTYPRCEIPASDALHLLRNTCHLGWRFAVVSHELHEDDGDHLHALICFKVYCEFDLPPKGTLTGPLINSVCVIRITAKIQNQEAAIF